MPSKSTVEKLVTALALAKAVNHYYWMHTEGDGPNGVEVENIQRIISLYCGVSIQKFQVEGESAHHRSWIERFDGGKRCVIYVTEDQPDDWKRFAVVKELCHILIDGEEDYQPDPAITADKVCRGESLLDDDVSVEKVSEDLSELTALELIYPIEDRRDDRALLASAGVSVEEIASRRNVPERYVYRGLSDASYNACIAVWRMLAPVNPDTLDHLL